MLPRRAHFEWKQLLPLLARCTGSFEPEVAASRGWQTSGRSNFSQREASSRNFFDLNVERGVPGHRLSSACNGSTVFSDFQRRYGIATSAFRSAGEGDGEEAVRSPLSQAPGPLGSAGGRQVGDSGIKTAQAVLTGIKQSPQKLNLVAEMVRGMRVEDALTQMAVSVKRAAKTVSKVVHSAQANAIHNFGMDKDRLVVSEAFVGKDKYLKRMRPHGKGKAGKLVHPRARLTVIVKEMSIEQETDLARLRVLRRQGTRMSRGQARLVPHRVLATKWNRQRTPPPASVESA